MESVRCSTCHAVVTPVEPSSTWRVLNVIFWTFGILTGVGFGLLLGLNLVLVPLWLGAGMAIGASARRASGYTCPVCHAEVIPPVEAAAPSGRLAPRPA